MKSEELFGLVKAASLCDSEGFYEEAELIDDILKQASTATYQNPLLMADLLARILQHLMYRSSPEKHQGFKQSLFNGLMRLNALELADKTPNNATAVGAAINIIKNVLMGQPPDVITSVVQRLERVF